MKKVTLIDESTNKGIWTIEVINITWKNGCIFAPYFDDKGNTQCLQLTPDSVGEGRHVVIE